MAEDAKMPGTDVVDGQLHQTGGTTTRGRAPKDGHLAVAELVSDRPAAPSPFGDDQEFPLPVDQLRYQPINP